MADYLDDNLFETDENQNLQMLHYDRIDICKITDSTKTNTSK